MGGQEVKERTDESQVNNEVGPGEDWQSRRGRERSEVEKREQESGRGKVEQ